MKPNYDPLFYWMRERENIRRRREQGKPFPWTTDPILKKYKFCNVRREDDTVTRWIKTCIRDYFADHPDLWFMLCIARQINWPDSLQALIDTAWPDLEDFSLERMERVLFKLQDADKKVFTGAYIITAPPTKNASKIDYVVNQTLGKLWKNRTRLAPFMTRSMQEAHSALLEYNGWGYFLAYQVVVDMQFCPALLAGAPDRRTWAAAGPGTIRGLNRLYGRDLGFHLLQPQALDEIKLIYPLVKDQFDDEPLEFSDVTGALCETDKYLRVKLGQGKPRSLYRPPVKGLFR